MEIIPAIDIRRGKCVRLYQGDFEQETVFHNDPVEVALKVRWTPLLGQDRGDIKIGSRYPEGV